MRSKEITRCLIVVLALLMTVGFIGAEKASAHTTPTGSTATGVGISITVFVADGTSPAVSAQPLAECEKVFVQATLSWLPGNAAFEGGTWRITLPDSTVVDVTPVGGVPCTGQVGNSTDDASLPGGRGLCASTAGFVTSALVPYTIQPGDIVAGKVTFRTDLDDAYAHIGTGDIAGVTAGTPINLAVDLCDDGDFCNGSEICDPTLVYGGFEERLGGCVPGTNPCVDDLFCADVTCNESTNECDTTNTSSTVCPDNLFCADVACNEATDQCDTTDTSTVVCPDNLFCADVACNEATDQCDTTDTSATVCPEDDSACTTITCNEQTDLCDTDTVSCAPDLPDVCCDPADGICKADPNLDPICAPMIAICRTPGYWKTHAGTEKGAFNVTQDVIDRCGGCITVCGTAIEDTASCKTGMSCEANCDSALEAMCDNPGKPFFHLTAMALNCCISGFGADCATGGDYLSTLFADANNSCTMGKSARFGEVDCWNNGGMYVDGQCWYGYCEGTDTLCTASTWDCNCVKFENNCHEMELCNDDWGVCYEGIPAGSPKACTDAKKNKCKVTANSGMCD